MAQLAPYISILALCVSVFTAWFTILRRGSVRSTRPSFIAVRYDFVDTKPAQAKIFLRTLLFSTGKRGWVIESLFLRVREGTRSEEFAFWGYGDKDLVRGSGLFVPENGVVTNHHFNPLRMEPPFLFSHGTYQLELVAQLLGRRASIPLWTLDIEIPRGAYDAAPLHATRQSSSAGHRIKLATSAPSRSAPEPCTRCQIRAADCTFISRSPAGGNAARVLAGAARRSIPCAAPPRTAPTSNHRASTAAVAMSEATKVGAPGGGGCEGCAGQHGHSCTCWTTQHQRVGGGLNNSAAARRTLQRVRLDARALEHERKLCERSATARDGERRNALR